MPGNEEKKHDGGNSKGLFADLTCGQFVKDQKVVKIDSQDSIHKALETLAKHDISSAPVYDALNSKYVRIVDFQALVSTGLTFVQEAKKLKVFNDKDDKVDELLDSVTVTILPNNFNDELNFENPFYTVLPNDPLSKAAKLLARERNYVHRVGVMSEDGEFIGIIAQSDLMRLVMNKLDHPSVVPILKKKVSEVKAFKAGVVSINSSKSVLDALSLMQSKHVSSVALVDKDGHMAGSITFSDIKHLLTERMYASLMKSCEEFYAHMLKRMDRKDQATIYTSCSPDDLLGDVIKRIHARHIHRVFIVDKDEPVGVISLTDILHFLTADVM